MSKKIYEMITNQIIEKLEQGTIPWRKPWINGVAVNWKTQKPYRGINTMLLDGGEYATFKQISEAGGKVKKGAKSHIVVFWKLTKVKEKDEKTGEETGEKITVPLLRYYRVFKVGEQTEGIERKRKEKEFNHDPIEEGEKIVNGYINAPDYTYHSGRAYYQPFTDVVNVPPLKDFEKPEEFYSTKFHEMVHSTGHKDRLNREGVKGLASFGSETYSKEELIAELGASMICGVAGIDNHTIENSASYIQSWLNALKNDKTLIVFASQQAQKAVDYILNVKFD
ncbi:ArdC family protein [Thalassobacillus sp. B23F22_16]|uniref:ArdC family protein n=1 Tax=Thalassobacillus sp. B23F22_16 TaxID=3459513 RepID=UPI00373EAA01